MKVAQIILWDGEIVYTPNPTPDSLRELIKRARKLYLKQGRRMRYSNVSITICDMSESDYHSLPTTNLAADLLDSGGGGHEKEIQAEEVQRSP